MSANDANRSTNGSGNVSERESDTDLDSTAKFNRDELVRGWHEYEAKMPRVIPVLKYAAKTDMGQVRENNEDKFDYYEPETPAVLAARGSLFAVADGVGGAQAGQIASEMLLKHLITNYYDHPAPDIETALRDAITDANDRVYSLAQMIPERNGMGSTLTAAIFIEDRVVVAQLGDSRAYLIRDGGIRQITQDHSWVEDQVRAGIMSRSDAELSPFRNVITRSIGAGPTVQPDFFVEQARLGDVWVLCSDGLTGYVGDTEIVQIAGRHAPSEAARQLIELANARGGRDNITVFVLAVRALIDPRTQANALVNTATSSLPTEPIPSPPTTPLDPAMLQQLAASPGPRTSLASEEEEQPRTGWRKIFGR